MSSPKIPTTPNHYSELLADKIHYSDMRVNDFYHYSEIMTPNKWAETFSVCLASEIQACRETRGLSKKMLAELAGLAPNYIGYIEKLERRPTAESVARIAFGLDMKMSELISRAEKSASKK